MVLCKSLKGAMFGSLMGAISVMTMPGRGGSEVGSAAAMVGLEKDWVSTTKARRHLEDLRVFRRAYAGGEALTQYARDPFEQHLGRAINEL